VIVLDENLDDHRVKTPLVSRYRGKVASIRDLRPGTVIKDDAIPAILCEQKNPTFVITNVSDFWHQTPAHPGYCIICFPLSTDRQDEIPELLMSLLRHRCFKTAKQRLGKILRVTCNDIAYYQSGHRETLKMLWK
jgi:hypothetical protein